MSAIKLTDPSIADLPSPLQPGDKLYVVRGGVDYRGDAADIALPYETRWLVDIQGVPTSSNRYWVAANPDEIGGLGSWRVFDWDSGTSTATTVRNLADGDLVSDALLGKILRIRFNSILNDLEFLQVEGQPTTAPAWGPVQRCYLNGSAATDAVDGLVYWAIQDVPYGAGTGNRPGLEPAFWATTTDLSAVRKVGDTMTGALGQTDAATGNQIILNANLGTVQFIGGDSVSYADMSSIGFLVDSATKSGRFSQSGATWTGTAFDAGASVAFNAPVGSGFIFNRQVELPGGGSGSQAITVSEATSLVAAESLLRTNPTINAQTGTTYTTLSTDAGKVVTLSNAAAITVTCSNLASGSWAVFRQKGAGQVTFATGGLTVRHVASLTKTAGLYAQVTAYVDGTDIILSGDMA